MARSKNKRRDTTDIARELDSLPNDLDGSFLDGLSIYEDRRQWHPEGIYAPARGFSKTRHRLRELAPKHKRDRKRAHSLEDLRSRLEGPYARLAFQAPDSTLICVRRQQRREVIHAKKKAGRGGQKKPRFTEYSNISCRRK